MTTTRAEFGMHAAEEVESKEYGKRTDEDGRGFRPSRIPVHILLIIFSILMFIPFMWMVFSAFKPLDEIFMRPPVMLPHSGRWTGSGPPGRVHRSPPPTSTASSLRPWSRSSRC